MRTPLFVANWKMNKTLAEAREYFAAFPGRVRDIAGNTAQIAIAPQALQLAAAVEALEGTFVGVAAQNSATAAWGAFTGEISPVALKQLGVQWTILGHSERRWIFHEDGPLLSQRLKAAREAGLRVILCVGERLVERKEGRTFRVLEEQLAVIRENADPHELALAYEPVWAIGTGETATPLQAQEAHAFIRQWLRDNHSEDTASHMRILYGGSAKADNAGLLMHEPDVDGLLVGGASLDPLGFAELVRNGVRSTT